MEAKRPPWGWIILIAVFVFGIAIIPILVAVGSNDPQEWLEDNYTRSGGVSVDSGGLRYRSEDDVDATAREVDAGTDASERRSEGENTYLRYGDDWLVVVSPGDGPAPTDPSGSTLSDGTTSDSLGGSSTDTDTDSGTGTTATGGGSTITLYEFDEGYRAHSGGIFFWSSHYRRGGIGGGGGSDYRGGGGGFGK